MPPLHIVVFTCIRVVSVLFCLMCCGSTVALCAFVGVLTVTVDGIDQVTLNRTYGKLYLVDLAGTAKLHLNQLHLLMLTHMSCYLLIRLANSDIFFHATPALARTMPCIMCMFFALHCCWTTAALLLFLPHSHAQGRSV